MKMQDANKKKTGLPDHKAELVKLIRQAAYRHGTWKVFSDFILMAATSISNSIDKRQFAEREKEYMETASKYEKAELDLFPHMFAELTLALQEHAEAKCPVDVLGEIFHEFNLQSEWHGQFFSPQNICNMMGEISIGENDLEVERKGYISVNEPCSGGGAMLFGLARAFAKRNYNYCKQMLVEASDIDIKCVYMTYIQLSLYGIPAVVYHRNTITMKTWSAWYTPIYIVDGWNWRKRLKQNKSNEIERPKNIEKVEPIKSCEQSTLF